MNLANQILAGDTFNIISEYLSVKDIHHLSLVNKILYNKITFKYILEFIKKKIKNRLQNILSENYDKFINILAKTKAVIHGSFIIQCILDESWDDSDIDICVGNPDNGEILEKFFEKNIYLESNFYGGHYDLSNNIDHVRTFDFGYYKIQVILINVTKYYTIKNHIEDTDFEICKNALTFGENGDFRLYIKNYKEIIHKTSTFTMSKDFTPRFMKYSDRGFLFKPKYNRLLYLEYMLLKSKIVLNTDFDQNSRFTDKLEPCLDNCPLKIFYRNVKHYHTFYKNLGTSEFNNRFNNKFNNRFNKISYNYVTNFVSVINVDCTDESLKNILLKLKTEFRDELNQMIKKCKNIDDYAKIRNSYSGQTPLNIYESSDYDIKYS